MKAYEIFQKLVPPDTECNANQYLYLDGKTLYHGFTCGGFHTWDIIQLHDSELPKGFVKRGSVPLHGAEVSGDDGYRWISNDDPNGSTYPLDEIKLATLDVKKLEKHWKCSEDYGIDVKQLGDAQYISRIYNDRYRGIFRSNGHDFICGNEKGLSFPLKYSVEKVTRMQNLAPILGDTFECCAVTIYPTLPVALWSNGETCVVSADYYLNTELEDGDLFIVAKDEKGNFVIREKKGTKTMRVKMNMPKVTLPESDVDEKAKAAAEVADKIVQPTTEAPNWEVPKKVEKEAEKVTENVEEESNSVEAEQVEKPVEESEEQLSLADVAQNVLQAAEFFEDELKTALTNYKVLVRAIKTLSKRVSKETKNSTDSKELKAAQAEIKSLQKANVALRQALIAGLGGESPKAK